jgi:lysophospholipase L1-like esterase
VLILLLNFNIKGQDTLAFNIPKVYDFENIPGDTFGNKNVLSTFFKQLENLKKNKNSTINILHIGDSHLQADYISHTIRIQLQKKFGSGGRGFITPLKISKSNEPYNYKTTSNSLWESQRCVSRNPKLPIGLGGMSIKTKELNTSIKIQSYNTDSISASFNKIVVFHTKSDSTFSMQLSDSSNTTYFPIDYKNSPYFTTFILPYPTNYIQIEFKKYDSIQNQFTLFGTLLSNNKPGILYHSIGINGAKYADFARASDFCEQTTQLSPNLCIISLGTNESFQKNYNSETFYKEIDSLVSKVRFFNPLTPIILTTPASSFCYYKTNYNLALISKTIIEYANNNNLAYWDLFTITGGETSANSWKKHNLLSRDGVHYTKEGYIHQGNLLTKALFNAYNSYVSTR